VSCWPGCVAPDIAGAVLFAGGAAATAAVAVEEADAEPAIFEAVTVTRMV
jgi:hypothetical protein